MINRVIAMQKVLPLLKLVFNKKDLWTFKGDVRFFDEINRVEVFFIPNSSNWLEYHLKDLRKFFDRFNAADLTGILTIDGEDILYKFVYSDSNIQWGIWDYLFSATKEEKDFIASSIKKSDILKFVNGTYILHTAGKDISIDVPNAIEFKFLLEIFLEKNNIYTNIYDRYLEFLKVLSDVFKE